MCDRVEAISGWIFVGAFLALLLPSVATVVTLDPTTWVVVALVAVITPGVVSLIFAGINLVRRLRTRSRVVPRLARLADRLPVA